MALIQLSQAQVPGLGSCPKVSTMHGFDTRAYLGKWFEIKKYPFVFTLGGKCITAEYGLYPNGTLSVYNTQLKHGKEDSILGTARIKEPGVLGVTFPSVLCQLNEFYLSRKFINKSFSYSSKRRKLSSC